jgi:hypothetical protein
MDLEERREQLMARCETLLGTVRQEGDSDTRARRRLQATERQALDAMREQIADLDLKIAGIQPPPPTAR